ncbi:MAG: hydrolase, partial [Archaeoglobaceae archaeon]
MKFENRLVLSAMAGINNADFCIKQKASLVILGGFNADKGAIEAGIKAMARGRKEFIFEDPLEGIEREIKKIKGKNFAVNVRSSSPEGYIEIARLVEEYDGILEINAHCRQPEFVSAR